MKSDQFFNGDQYFSPTKNFSRLKLTPTKKIYQLFFLLSTNQITEILKKKSDLLYHNLVEWRWVGKVVKKEKFKNQKKISHVVASYVCRKNMFCNQTSLKGFSTFSTISLAFSIALVIPALLKPFTDIS